jgi:hypothetical protein
MKLDQVFPSNYLKADDLKGREVTVTIREAKMEKLGEDQRLVCHFAGKEKGLVTNRTNADRIAYYHGDDTDGWIGKQIILGTELVSFQGKTTPALRVKGIPLAQQAPAPAPEAPPFDDEVGF